VAVVAGVLTGCGGPPSGATTTANQDSQGRAKVTHERLLRAAEEPGQWMARGGDYRNLQHSALTQVTTQNVASLGLAWFMDMDTRRGVSATPIVVDGVMYVTGSWSQLYALDAKSGARLWKYDPQVPGSYATKGCCDVVNRGVAVWDGKVLLATFDGRLVALDAASGAVAWSVDTIVDRSVPYTITGAPLVANGVVVIGNGGGEYGVRGYVTAYDIATGRELWRFFTVPGDPAKPFESAAMRMAAKTWTGEWWKLGGGGTVWDSMAYDPELDLIYLGVGNGSPWNRAIRSPGGGDNLFLSSIVAVRRTTGEYVWHFQQVPGDQWDYTATQHLMLLDLQIDGRLRKTIVQAPKNGFFYVLDRATGEFISARNFVPVNWTTGLDPRTGQPTFAEGIRYEKKPADVLPGPTGAHNWHPMAWSPEAGLVYIPALELGATRFAKDPNYRVRPGFYNIGVDPKNFVYPEDPAVIDEVAASLKGPLIAWDPVAQREVWRFDHRAPWNGGVLATAGGLVFQGTSDGHLLALDARTGRELWRYFLQTGVMAAPVSFELDGEQYIAVAVGWGSHYGLDWGDFALRATGGLPNLSRVVAFKLGGNVKLPAGSKLPSQPRPAVAPLPSHTPDVIEKGRVLYAFHCAGCHGGAAVSGGVLPDLRYSSAGAHSAWEKIVLEGMLEARGMKNFSGLLTAQEAEAIRAFVVHRAHQTWNAAQTQGKN
jgi:quinohemoprotein ethanol dehydrogenase